MLLNKIEHFEPLPCIEVKQGFGTFYVCAIKAKDLLEICQPIRADILDGEIDNDPFEAGIFKPAGPQRKVGEKRPEQIARYISTGMAAFPNSIIIGANITDEGFLLDEESRQWIYSNGCISIEDNACAAAIIDGQHRLQGYELIKKSNSNLECLEDELVCSIYLDLPITYHAQLFSTINSTQRKVPKNLIYQLYQIDMDERKPQYWSPEVLSVYLSRALGMDPESALFKRLVLAVDKRPNGLQKDWNVSLSAVVEGLLKLFSSKPLDDRESFHSDKMEVVKRTDLKNDKSPWRFEYINNKDRDIYENVRDFINFIYANDKDMDSAFKSSIGISSILAAFAEILTAFNGNYKNIQSRFKSDIYELKFRALPKDRVSKNKKLLKDSIVSFFL